MNLFSILFTSSLTFFLVFSAYAQDVTLSVRSQTAIAMDLESVEPDRVEKALNDLFDLTRGVGLKNAATPQIKMALMTAMSNEMDRRSSVRPGQTFDHMHEELLIFLTDAVIALEDPDTIPLLISVAHMGNTPRMSLLDFGPSIIPALVDYSMSGNLTDSQLSGTLDMFRIARKEWGGFDIDTRTHIKRLVIEHLTVPEGYVNDFNETSLARWAAIDLAAEMGDTDLKPLVEALIPVEDQYIIAHGLSLERNRARRALSRWGKEMYPASDHIERDLNDPQYR